jgi:hypothetical protein
VHPNSSSQKTRLRFTYRTARIRRNRLIWLRHVFVMVTLSTAFRLFDGLGDPGDRYQVVEPLCATGKRRQNFNLYGLGELLLKIFLMGHPSIDQYRAELDDPIEARIRPLPASKSEGLSDG